MVVILRWTCNQICVSQSRPLFKCFLWTIKLNKHDLLALIIGNIVSQGDCWSAISVFEKKRKMTREQPFCSSKNAY